MFAEWHNALIVSVHRQRQNHSLAASYHEAEGQGHLVAAAEGEGHLVAAAAEEGHLVAAAAAEGHLVAAEVGRDPLENRRAFLLDEFMSTSPQRVGRSHSLLSMSGE